jgi:hypothetical protein
MSEQETRPGVPEQIALTAAEIEEQYGHEGGMPLILLNHPEIDLLLTNEQLQRIYEIQNHSDEQNG